MTFEQIGSIVIACIISAGGIGGIIIAVIKFTSEIIAKRLEQKYEMRINETLESHKAKLENRTHISSALFDKELEIYQSLCYVFYEAYSKYEILRGLESLETKIIPKSEITYYNNLDLLKKLEDGEAVPEMYITKLEDEIGEKIIEFKKILYSSGAFIPHDNQKLFLDIGKCFQACLLDKSEDNYKKLLALRGKMQAEIRNYLENLSIID